MKQTLNLHDFREAFRTYNRLDQFSWEGLEILFDYFEDCDPEMELDVVAICCDYYEDTWQAVARDYEIDVSDLDPEDDEAECIERVRDYLNAYTCIVGETSTGAFIYQCF